MNKIGKYINWIGQFIKFILLMILILVILGELLVAIGMMPMMTCPNEKALEIMLIMKELMKFIYELIVVNKIFLILLIFIFVFISLFWCYIKKHNAIFLMLSIIYIVLIWYIYGYACLACTENSPKTAGEFGDMYGALNTLFSGFAFAVIAITLCVEMRALREQKHDAQLQIIDAASFEYLKYMKECEPEKVEDGKENVDKIEKIIRDLFNDGKNRTREDKKENIEKAEKIIRDLFRDEKNIEVDELEKIYELRKNLLCLSAWRRVMSSWFMKVDHFSITKKEKKEYKRQFWHLLSKKERIVAYFQVFLFSKTHKEEADTMEKLFRSEVLIKDLIGTQDQKYKDLKLLLKKEGEGDYKLTLNEELFNKAKKGK